MGYYLTLTSTLQLVFDLGFFLLLLSNSSFSKRLKLYVLLCHSKSNNDYIRKIQGPAVVAKCNLLLSYRPWKLGHMGSVI